MLPVCAAVGDVCIVSLHFEVIENDGHLLVGRRYECVRAVRICGKNGCGQSVIAECASRNGISGSSSPAT